MPLPRVTSEGAPMPLRASQRLSVRRTGASLVRGDSEGAPTAELNTGAHRG